MKKVFITGANGFIGSHLCESFQNTNYEVVGSGFSEPENNLGYKFLNIDFLHDDIESMLSNIKPDIIIHCAGSADVHKSIVDPFFDFQGNTAMLHRILFTMKKLNLENCRFVFLSSAAVYGQPRQLPIKENSPMNPLSPYALHKKMCEDICDYFINNYNFNIKIVRIFSAYGPRLKKQIFWDMNKKIEEINKLVMLGTGDESRDYIYISDLVNAIHLVATDNHRGINVYNIANGEEVYIKDIAEMFAKEKGLSLDKIIFDGHVREGDPINWRADINEMEKLGYRKNIDIKMGIKMYLDWIRENKIL